MKRFIYPIPVIFLIFLVLLCEKRNTLDSIKRIDFGSIDGSVAGNTSYVCTNGTDIIYYNVHSFWKYGENGFNTVLCSLPDDDYYYDEMACTSEKLYYYTKRDKDYILYSVPLSGGEEENISAKYGFKYVNSMVTHGEDLFLDVTYDDKERLIMLNDDVVVAEFTLNEDQNEALYGDYDIKYIGDRYYKQYHITSSDGWQYSGTMYTQVNVDGYIVDVETGEYPLWGDTTHITVNGTTCDIRDSVLAGNEEYNAYTSAPKCAVYNDSLYLVYEAGKAGTSKSYKDKEAPDSVWKFTPATGDMELIYEAEPMPVQIAGFSAKRNCVYILTLRGMYQVSLDTGDETLLFDADNISQNGITVEDCDGKLFVFDGCGYKYETLLGVF